MKSVTSSIAAFARDMFAKYSEWFRREWKYIILSLGIAMAAFFLIQGEVIHSTTLDVPVVMADYSEGLWRTKVPEKKDFEASPDLRTVKVEFRGDANELAALGAGANISIRIPYPSQKKRTEALEGDGKVKVFLRRRFVDGARTRDARPVEFDPDYVFVTIDESEEYEFNVEPAITGSPATNHVVNVKRDIQFDTMTVKVRGPKSRLKRLSEEGVALRTDPIDLEGRAQNFEARVKVRPPVDVPDAKVDPSEVFVKVTVGEVQGAQSLIGEISNVPVRVTQETGGLGVSWIADPAFVMLRVRGNTNSVAAIQSEHSKLFAVVHAENGDDASKSHRVWTFLPEEFKDTVQIVSVVPQSVTLRRIEREESPAEPTDGTTDADGTANDEQRPAKEESVETPASREAPAE